MNTGHSIYIQISKYRHKSLTLRTHSVHWRSSQVLQASYTSLSSDQFGPLVREAEYIISPSPSLWICLSQLCKLMFSFISLPGPPESFSHDASLGFPLISYNCPPLPVLSFQLSTLTNVPIGHRFNSCIMVNNTGPDTSRRDMCKWRISVFQMGTTACFTCRSQCLDTVPSTLLWRESNELVKMNNEQFYTETTRNAYSYWFVFLATFAFWEYQLGKLLRTQTQGTIKLL